MKRRDFTAQLGLSISLPVALGSVAPEALAQGAPEEGKHFRKLPQALPGTPGKIEVVEFFWYGCPHCYAFEPMIEAWVKNLPADVAFRKVHIAFRENTKVHQRVFYALEAMGKEAQVRQQIFDAMHRQRNYLETQAAAAEFLGKLGIDVAKFNEAYNSFGVMTKCQQAVKLSEAYRIEGVPALGIGGRFLTAPSMAGAGMGLSELESGRRALMLTDQLIQRVRKG